ncbi:MAG TPA: MFS transporter, partial [Acidimicrobiia bacterium]|nr:MFS transporter [Acidimicrobiia bacterium]
MDEAGGFLIPGAFESFRLDLGLTYTQASIVLVAPAPGALLGNGLSIAVDHRSRRAITATGAFGFAASLCSVAVTPGFAACVAAAFVLGAAATLTIRGSDVSLVDMAGDAPTTMIARSHVFGAAGDLFGPALLVLVAATGLGWRVAFATFGVLAFAYAGWLASLRFPPPPPAPDGHRVRDSLRDITRDRRVWWCAFVALLLGPLDEPFLAFLIATLEREQHLSAWLATAIVVSSIAGNLVGFLQTGRAGHTPAPLAMASNAAILACTTAIAVVAPWPVVIVAIFVSGWATAHFFIALMDRIVALHPGRLGTVQAVITTVEFSG